MARSEGASIGTSTPPPFGHLDGRDYTVKLFPLLHPQFFFKLSAQAEFISIIPTYLSWTAFWSYRFLRMAFQPDERRVVFVGDSKIGRSSFITMCMPERPFLDSHPSYLWRPSIVRLVTDLESENLPCLPEPTSTTSSRMEVVRNLRQTQLHVVNVDDKAPIKFRRYFYSFATAVVFCFSIADESSFENIKNKVNWPHLTTHLQIMRADLWVRSVVP